MPGSLAQLALDAAALGAAYALVAAGFVLVLGATGAVNFAQGDLVMAGGFAAVVVGGLIPLPGLALLPLVALAMAALGLAVGAVAYLPLRNRPPTAVFVSTIAVGIILQNGANALFGQAPRAAPALVEGGPLRVAGLVLDRQDAAIIVVAAATLGALALVMERTQLGRRLRATAQDAEMARAVGIRVTRLRLLSFALGAALAGIAGLLLANRYFVTPSAGGGLMLKAYVAATIGGWGRLGGAALGALLIGVFETVVAALVSYVAAEALLYLVLLLVLAVRPQGLFGEAAGRRA